MKSQVVRRLVSSFWGFDLCQGTDIVLRRLQLVNLIRLRCILLHAIRKRQHEIIGMVGKGLPGCHMGGVLDVQRSLLVLEGFV